MKIIATNPKTIVVKTILTTNEVKYLLNNKGFIAQVNVLTDGSLCISYIGDLEKIISFLKEI